MDSEKSNPKIGRTTRLEYWVLMVVFLTPGILIAEHSTSWVGLVVLVLLTIPIVHAYIGRWHDLGYSGWMTLLIFIPYIGFLSSIPLAFMKGNEKGNKYGPSPYVDK